MVVRRAEQDIRERRGHRHREGIEQVDALVGYLLSGFGHCAGPVLELYDYDLFLYGIDALLLEELAGLRQVRRLYDKVGADASVFRRHEQWLDALLLYLFGEFRDLLECGVL